MTTKTGRFITFEGVDGAGKSTHMQSVKRHLEKCGFECVITREPGGTGVGEKIRDLVLQNDMQTRTELLLMYAARVEHVETLIKPALARGVWVLSDRFEDSSFAYQGHGSELGWPACEALSKWALNGFGPDLTFLFDLPVAVSMQRVLARQGQTDRFEMRSAGYFESVRLGFLKRARQQPERIKVLDAQQTELVVGQQVIEFLDTFLLSMGVSPAPGGEGQ